MKSILPILFLLFSSTSFSQTFEWAVDANGGNVVASFAIATDAANNIYITGYFDGNIDFDPGAGITTVTDNGAVDVFVLKLDSDHNFQWVKTIGGVQDDRAYGIAVDESGNVYTCGEFRQTVDFDPSPGVFNMTTDGSNSDLFIQKLDTDGNFLWAKRFGGGQSEEIFNITIDNAGNIIATGGFLGLADFDPGAGIAELDAGYSNDVFILKLNAEGEYIWAKRVGNNSESIGQAIATDDSENVYITGSFWATVDFDPSLDGTFNLVGNGSSDMFLLKLNADGDFVWAKSCGSNQYDLGKAINVSHLNYIYVGGEFSSTIDLDPNDGIEEITSNGQSDLFLQKFDTDGNLIWVRTQGTTEDEVMGYKIAIDEYEYISIISSLNFSPYKTTITSYASPGYTRWSVDLEGVQYGFSIASDSEGYVYGSGVFTGSHDFNPFAATNILSTASADYYLLKLGSVPNSIDELNKSVSFTVYPNPSEGNLTIKMPNQMKSTEISIVNSAGKTILKNTLNQTETTINTDLESGIYFIVMTLNSGEVITEKLIVN